jgi:hypothetical protein
VLWIYAIPGAGKTVLASHIVKVLRQEKLPGAQLLYFFFRHSDINKETPLVAVRALTHQLLHAPGAAESIPFLESLVHQMDSGGQARVVGLRALWNTFSDYCSKQPSVTIVLDALDECSAVAQLLPRLLKLAQCSAVKVLLTGRREADLVRELKGMACLNIGPDEVRDDIEAFTTHTVVHSDVLSNPLIRHQIVRMVTERSQGMFLWMVLVLRVLESIVLVQDIEGAILSMPETLEGVYERILRRLSQTLKGQQKSVCCRILKWLALAKRTLQLHEVREALRLDFSSDRSGSLSENLLISESQLELFCGSLVTVRSRLIRLVHASTHEYLQRTPHEQLPGNTLDEFFVDAGAENARIAGLCTSYLLTHCDSRNRNAEKLSSETLKAFHLLIEYSCFNWLAHLTESDPQALVKQEAIVGPFIRSRRPLYWLEFSMVLDPTCLTVLTFMLQTLLDWLASGGTEDIVNMTTPGELLSLLRCWGELFLRVVTDYRQLLEQAPQTICYIDLEPMASSDQMRILSGLERDDSCEEHVVINEVNMFVEHNILPDYRHLPQNSGANEYLHFVVDERRGLLIFVDQAPHRCPRLYCQETATGRRLQPILDLELQDEVLELVTQEMTISPDAQLLAIVHLATHHSGIRHQGTVFTAVWTIPYDIDFDRRKNSLPWARKLISLTTEKGLGRTNFALPIIAFHGNRFLSCPNGRIELSSSLEQVLPYWSKTSPNSEAASFSASGDVMVFQTERSPILKIVELTGAIDDVTMPGESIYISCVSVTGRHIVYMASGDHCGMIYDRTLRVRSSLNFDVKGYFPYKCIFSSDDKQLYIHFCRGGSWEEILAVGMMRESSFNLLSTQHFGSILAWWLDKSDGMLYIVTPGRILSRLRLNGSKLCQVDPPGHVQQKYCRIEQCVSGDCSRLAILHVGKIASVTSCGTIGTCVLTTISGPRSKSSTYVNAKRHTRRQFSCPEIHLTPLWLLSVPTFC